MRVIEGQAESHLDLHALPRFQRAPRQLRALRGGMVALFVGLLLLLFAAWRWPAWPWRALLLINAAMWLVLLAAVQACYWVVNWRRQALTSTPTGAVAAVRGWRRLLHPQQWPWLHALRQVLWQLSATARAALGIVCLTMLSLIFGVYAWRTPLLAAPDTSALLFAALAAICACGLLVLERYCAGALRSELPEAKQLTGMLRVAIGVASLSAAWILLGSMSAWPARLLWCIAVLPMALAVELLLRASLSVFTPPQPQREPTMLAHSLLADLWRWPPQPWRHLHDELQQRFGIDLRQNWAFAYLRRAMLPVLSIVLLCAWLLSGLTEVPVAARAIHERFGQPVAVWQPGLHLALPWPLSQVRWVENGVVHELATASAADAPRVNTKTDNTGSLAESDSAEGPPPASAHRLWDASHVAEKSQVIASGTADGQSFHIVNMDVRFIYRIGLTDAAALAASYRSADIATLLRSSASRILVRYFASRTLQGVLGEARTRLALDIGAQVQAELDALGSGVEILATVVEAIHPPAAAAYAYHSVQAAQIGAQAIIARERGNAAEQLNLAQLRAHMATAAASAAARETLVAAQTTQLRFNAERRAYQTAGKAFVMEQYLAQLQGLANAPLVVVDHRLKNISTSIDLRAVPGPGAETGE